MQGLGPQACAHLQAGCELFELIRPLLDQCVVDNDQCELERDGVHAVVKLALEAGEAGVVDDRAIGGWVGEHESRTYGRFPHALTNGGG